MPVRNREPGILPEPRSRRTIADDQAAHHPDGRLYTRANHSDPGIARDNPGLHSCLFLNAFGNRAARLRVHRVFEIVADERRLNQRRFCRDGGE